MDTDDRRKLNLTSVECTFGVGRNAPGGNESTSLAVAKSEVVMDKGPQFLEPTSPVILVATSL